jgi:c-di-GMP-binding flagellar brake protein YcgR
MNYGYILQSQYIRIPTGGDLNGVLIFLGAVVLFVIISIIANRFMRQSDAQSSSKRRYSKFMFDRIGYDMGLSKNNMQYLVHLVKTLKVRYPILIFTNHQLLDAVLKRAIASVEKQAHLPENERIRQLNLIYEIKQAIELNSKKSIGIKSTFLIKSGQSVILTTTSGERFHSKVITNHTSALTLAYPIIPIEKDPLLKKGNKIKVFFWRENDSGYSFMSKINESNKSYATPYLYIQHSRSLKREQHRKFSRKPLKKSCFIYPMEVESETNSRNTRMKVKVNTGMRHAGFVSDISVGGCSITTSRAYKKGAYIKLEFDIEPSSPISAYAKVQSTFRHGTAGTSIKMHLQFVRLSNKDRNRIYSYVYNYI